MDLPDRESAIAILGAIFHTARLINGQSPAPAFTSTEQFEKHRELQIAADLDRAQAFIEAIEQRFPDKPAKPGKPGK